MKDIEYIKALQEIATSKQLTQFNFSGAPTFIAAYILDVNEDFITIAAVDRAAKLAGVTITHVDDFDSFSVDTIYLGELSRQLKGDEVYKQGRKAIEHVREYTIDGFIEAFEDTNTIVEITAPDADDTAGKIVGHGNDVLVIDEYTSESDRRTARTFIRKNSITRISLEVPWLRTITRSLADKNL